MSIELYCIHDNDKEQKKKGAISVAKARADSLNDQGWGVFFTVNSFGGERRVETNLKKIRFFFIDYDDGSKEEMLAAIESFELVPSWLVETNKGFHCYWKCEEDFVKENRIEEYKDLLENLVDHFGADQNGKGVTRILRVPGYYHHKDPSNPFLIREVFKCDEKYTAEQIAKAIGKKEVVKEIAINVGKTISSNNMPSDNFWNLVYDLDCEKYLPLLSGSPECNGEIFSVVPKGIKKNIYVNGELIESCWIDADGMIGSHDNGGPTIGNWVYWYVKDWDKVASCLKKAIPLLSQNTKYNTIRIGR